MGVDIQPPGPILSSWSDIRPFSSLCALILVDTSYALRYSNPLTHLTQSLKKLATTENNHVKMQHNWKELRGVQLSEHIGTKYLEYM